MISPTRTPRLRSCGSRRGVDPVRRREVCDELDPSGHFERQLHRLLRMIPLWQVEWRFAAPLLGLPWMALRVQDLAMHHSRLLRREGSVSCSSHSPIGLMRRVVLLIRPGAALPAPAGGATGGAF